MSAFRLASLLDPHVHGVMTPAQLEEFRRWRSSVGSVSLSEESPW